jgi:hypothetical protein
MWLDGGGKSPNEQVAKREIEGDAGKVAGRWPFNSVKGVRAVLVGIPTKPNVQSRMIPNGIPGWPEHHPYQIRYQSMERSPIQIPHQSASVTLV